MGNWTSVELDGACAKEDLAALRTAIEPGKDYSNFHCLSAGSGVCGLGGWAAEKIRAHGNLSERGYDSDDVKNTLEDLAKAAPSLRLKVHMGGDYEDKKCVATVSLEGGVATVAPPAIETIADISDGDMHNRVMGALARGRTT